MADRTSALKQSLAAPNTFTVTFELVPSRGGRSKEHNRTLELARQLAADNRIQAVSITENAGGHAALSPEVLGLEIKETGLEIIVHLSCKDKNRNQLESLLFAWDRLGIRNLLVLTGDYPQEGYQGYAKPVFDLGSVHLLNMINRMNHGDFGPERKKTCIRPTSFVSGVALSPFKRLEAELMMQYAKLHRKAGQGADYVITQIGYDARKFEEVLLYMHRRGIDLPVLGNVFVPNLGVTKLMHKGQIPGCIITDRLYETIQEEATGPDKGKKARLIRAAKLLAVQKGLGYAGAHIGGPGLKYEDIDFLLSRADEYASGWRELVRELDFWHEDGFYYFKKDPGTGLNRPEPADREAEEKFLLNYRLAKKVHHLAFEPDGPLYAPSKNICLAFEETRLKNLLGHMEHVIKFLLFNCQNCGDCSLGELAFVCPQGGCAKYQLNGACGGSKDGWCEVSPGKKRCLFVRVYERLKSCGLDKQMRSGFVPPRNWELNNTSSWLNFYKGTDHQAGSSTK